MCCCVNDAILDSDVEQMQLGSSVLSVPAVCRRLAASTLKLLLRNLMRSRTRKLLTINKSNNMNACCVYLHIQIKSLRCSA